MDQPIRPRSAVLKDLREQERQIDAKFKRIWDHTVYTEGGTHADDAKLRELTDELEDVRLCIALVAGLEAEYIS